VFGDDSGNIDKLVHSNSLYLPWAGMDGLRLSALSTDSIINGFFDGIPCIQFFLLG